MTLSERVEAARRGRRVLTRVSRAGWRLQQAGRERVWALVMNRPIMLTSYMGYSQGKHETCHELILN